MRITDVKLRLLSGSMPVEAEFWEERLSRPLDVYPEHKAALARFGTTRLTEKSSEPIEAVFVQIETDEGLSGLGGPIQPSAPTSSTSNCAGCCTTPTQSRVSACGI